MTPVLDSVRLSLSKPPADTTVLAVDLDGTLLKTDVLLESLLRMLHGKPQYVFLLPWWLLRGKAYFKRQIARRVVLDVRALPYREDFLEDLRAQRATGRTLVLATGADGIYARQIADHLKLFDSIFASDGCINLTGKSKRDCLVEEFGEKGFDYVGNDRSDLVVWSSARKAIVVNPKPVGGATVARLQALRPQHWL